VTEGLSPVTQQYILRLAAIPFGLLVVLLAYLTAATLFRRDVFLSVTTAAFVAFQPQVSYEAAMVNNDVAGIAVVSLILYLTVRGLRDGFPRRQLVLLGLAIGLGLLTKSTTIIALPGVALAILLGTGVRNVRQWLGCGALTAGVAACLVWPWYLRLWRTYGNLSGLPQIERLQFRWIYPAGQSPSVTDLLFNADFALMRWRETWGLFGWRLIPLDGTLLLAIGIACLIGMAGLGRVAWLAARLPADGSVLAPARWQLVGLGALVVTCLSAYAAVIQFGLTFVLTQARYFFPAIAPVGLLLMLGWRALLPERALRYGQAAILLGLILLHVAIYTQYVIPYWYLSS
jgi:4-amino-4-deoxy-L-arabinose transferase-like glycosyltransferase